MTFSSHSHVLHGLWLPFRVGAAPGVVRRKPGADLCMLFLCNTGCFSFCFIFSMVLYPRYTKYFFFKKREVCFGGLRICASNMCLPSLAGTHMSPWPALPSGQCVLLGRALCCQLAKAPWGEAVLWGSGTNLKDNYITSLIKVELCEDERQTTG